MKYEKMKNPKNHYKNLKTVRGFNWVQWDTGLHWFQRGLGSDMILVSAQECDIETGQYLVMMEKKYQDKFKRRFKDKNA